MGDQKAAICFLLPDTLSRATYTTKSESLPADVAIAKRHEGRESWHVGNENWHVGPFAKQHRRHVFGTWE